MGRHTLLILGVVAVAAAPAGCGSTSSTTTVTAPTATTLTTRPPVSPPTTTTLTVFRLRRGTLHPATVRVPHTTAVATAALGALGLAAPVTFAHGTASVRLDNVSPGAIAEIVYTLTQFPSISHVDVSGRDGLTRHDFVAYLPPIFVEAPAAGAYVRKSFGVAGSAIVFEATLVVELVRDDKVIEKQTVTASEGAPARGSFETTLHATSPGAATVMVFAPSAENGLPQHEFDVPVMIRP